VLGAAAVALATRGEGAVTAGSALGKLLDRRRMVRKFRPTPIPDEAIARCLHAAARAPSAGNTEPWAFVVARDAAIRQRLARAALDQAFVAEAPVVIVACADVPRSKARYAARGERYAVIDVAFASLLLLLQATEEGLGACFVGAFDDARVAKAIGLPPHVLPLAVIPVGVPAERPRNVRLRPERDIVHRDRW
jgi:nitroreductase